MNGILQWLEQLPPVLVYLFIAIGAAIENIIPPVPADTFVLLGAFLSASGRASTWGVFLATWLANVGSATLVYFLARKHGRSFFRTRVGHFLLHPKQLEEIGKFYDRWGTPAILISRFLPAFRAVVPVFAGVTHVSWPRLVIPAAIASAAWYGMLVYIGASASRNWEEIVAFFQRFSNVLLGVAVVLIAAVGVWWWKSRRAHRHH